MEPAIKKGEVVKIEQVDITDFKEGDIVIFKPESAGNRNSILTRIISINSEKGTFTGKADANQESIYYEINIPLTEIESRVVSE